MKKVRFLTFFLKKVRKYAKNSTFEKHNSRTRVNIGFQKKNRL